MMELRNEIIAWLKQYRNNLDLQETTGRKALLFQAGLDLLQGSIPLGGSTDLFFATLVEKLLGYGSLPDGRAPLAAVLEFARPSQAVSKGAGAPGSERCRPVD